MSTLNKRILKMTSNSIESAKEFVSNLGYKVINNSVFYGNVPDWKNEIVSFDKKCIYLYKVSIDENYKPYFSTSPNRIFFLDEFEEKFNNTIKFYKNCLSIYKLHQLNKDFNT